MEGGHCCGRCAILCTARCIRGILVYSDDCTGNRTALHALCMDHVTPEALAQIVQINPLWSATTDSSGCLPLHSLCQNAALEPQWITWLVELNTRAASQEDRLGRLPLHYLCSSAGVSLEALSLMLEANQCVAAKHDTIFSKLALHYQLQFASVSC